MLGHLRPVALSQLASGLSLLAVTPGDTWCQAFEAATLGQLSDWEPIHLCNVLKVFATWEYR